MASTPPLILTDIDIDFADRDTAISGLGIIPAMQMTNGKTVRHATGVYFQDVPVDPLTGLCVYDHKTAGEYGYFKIDFLPNHLYAPVRDEEHLEELLAREPEWSLLEFDDVVGEMYHIRDHADVVAAIAPKSVEDLAVVLALIRPGKRQLVGKPREIVDATIWEPNADGYTFKRSHAIAYATSLVVQLNLIQDRMIAEMESEDDVVISF
jgi:hypothetical protein